MMNLAEIDRAALLRSRAARRPDHEAENRSLLHLSAELARPNGNVLGALADAALQLCAADSAGISILEPDAAQPSFRWHAIKGKWAKYEGQGLPRDSSPCGVTITRNQVCLMSHPERVFPALAEAEPAIDEALLAPFVLLGEPLGTVWVIHHDVAEHGFDLEDERLIRSLALFASNAFLLQDQLRQAVEARDELFRANRRLTKIVERLGDPTPPYS